MSSRVVMLILVVVTLVGAGVWWKFRGLVERDSAKSDPIVVLAEAKQKAIWDAEHIAFELESRFGKPFMAALADGDTTQLLTSFRADCVADLGQESDHVIKQVGVVNESVRRFEDSGRDDGADTLVQSLVDDTVEFDTLSRRRLRVLHVKETPRESGHWKTHLLMTASGNDQDGSLIQKESEHFVTFQLATEAKIPVREIISEWHIHKMISRRSPHRLMEEVTTAVGLDQLNLVDNWLTPPARVNTYNFQMAVEDFDRDGFLDIAIAAGNRHPILLHSENGERFHDVASDMGLRRWTGTSALVGWIDYNNDGFPDLLMGDRVYANQEGVGFKEVASGLKVGYDPMGCVVADYDCDGWLDLYILYQHSTSPPETTPWVGDNQSGALNQLWRNDGNGRFEDVTLKTNASSGFRLSFAAAWLFLNEDHFPDLYVANDFGGNMLLQNTGQGTFENVTQDVGVGDFATSMGVAAGDMNNDGSPEIYVANMYSKMGRRIIAQISKADYPPGIYEQIRGSCAGNRLYSKKPDSSSFQELSETFGVNRVGWAFAPAFVDLNNDGWQDLYAATGYLSFNPKKPDG